MQKENPVNMETLNVIQQVLRGALLAIAAANRSDLQVCAELMQAHAQHPDLDSRAQTMLIDLAAGFANMDLLLASQTSAAKPKH